MQNPTTIVDSKDGRILLSVDGCTLNAVLEALVVKAAEPRLVEIINAIHSYHDYKNAQKIVARYGQPARVAAIKNVFAGKKTKA